jgi:hypothetical protein
MGDRKIAREKMLRVRDEVDGWELNSTFDELAIWW